MKRAGWIVATVLTGSIVAGVASAKGKPARARDSAAAARGVAGYGKVTWATTQAQLESQFGAEEARDAAPDSTPPGATVLTLAQYPAAQYEGGSVIEAPGIIIKCHGGKPFQIVVPYSFLLQRDDSSGRLVLEQAIKDLGKPTKVHREQDAPDATMAALQVPYGREGAQLVAEWEGGEATAHLVFAGFRHGEAQHRQLVITHRARWDAIKSEAAPQPEAQEQAADEPVIIKGWRTFRFGASVEAVKREFPKLALAENPPFKDPKPLASVQTYSTTVATPDTRGVFLRFHKNRLFYVLVGFDYDALGVDDHTDLLRFLKTELGEPATVKKAIKPGRRLPTVIANWSTPEGSAQLVFNQQHFADKGDATLHVVSEAIDAEVQKELGR